MLQSREQFSRMDRRITFQSRIIGENESNEDAEIGWEDVVTVWAEVSDATGREELQAEQITAYKASEFTIRHRTVDVKWRIVFDDEKYNILSVQRVNRNGYLKILAAVGVKYQEAGT